MKPTIHFLLIVLLCGVGIPRVLGQDYTVLKDLHAEWQVNQGDAFEPFNKKSDVSTVYFWIEAAKFPGVVLHVNSTEPFSLFVNGQLAAQHSTGLYLKIDSLRKIFRTPVLQVGVHQAKIKEGGLQTTLETVSPASSTDVSPLKFSSFRDFAIVGMLILLTMLVIIIKLNPKLTSDYFSITKIFSMREGEESQVYSRITSSINILFYAYSSLMLGYYLVIIFHFLPAHYSAALAFQADTFWEAMRQWLELSFIVLTLFFMKIVLVYGLSFVFGMREIAGIHFFNWVRLLLGVFGILTIILFLYFVTHGQREGFYVFLLSVMSWLLAGWTLLIILKLQRHMGHSMFHLFSYICATELIPFLITIKVLYN
ncbi:DUF4271 domain-containing protein [Chryseolinea lacunae]|uniref:DUF4271 domain-containing protein n=1 Tax=Chryseolinea lacunae TaxID=2801331 RepID=A0ABS1KS05_9BACT|nr:DUF4271 domain-containing protein [Chryseolinea lacunae]MBL0742144.1 DUF4271 domain-containing protein [Chryseolinea lacunae]